MTSFSPTTPTTDRAMGGRHSPGSPLVMTLLVGILTLAIAAGANAGTYVIDNCPSAPGANGDPGPWKVFGAPQNTKGSCTGGPGNWIGPEGGSMSPGGLDGVQVTVPSGSGITIREAKAWWFVPHQSSGADTFALASVNTGIIGESGTPLDRSITPDDFVLPSTTTELTLADYCSNDDAGNGCVFGAGENPNLELLGSQLTLADSNLPSGTVTGGALAGAATLSGTESLSYNAQDADSGIRLVELRVDGQLAAQNDYISNCPYTDFAACPPSESNTISWNTASVADGEHSMELTTQDAAQNTTVVYDSTITTHNAPAKTSSLGTLPGPSTGGGASAAVTVVGGGAPNGTGASENAQLRLGVHRTVSRTFAHRAFRLTGRLLDDLSDPIGNATLVIVQQIAGSSGTRVVAYARTRSDGGFAVGVPAGPSRLIDVAYRAFSTDTGYAAQASIEESVGAGVQLNVSPRRTSSTGTITLSGRVFGPVPSQGVVVELLVHYRGHWEPFRTPRTDSNGRFTVVYQFEGGVGRFPFRVAVFGGQSEFPFTHGESRSVDVTTN